MGVSVPKPRFFTVRKQFDYSALKYVNLKRPNIKSDKLLGERIHGGKAVLYNTPEVSHQWEFTGYMAQESFQADLGRVFDQNNDPIDVSSGRTRREENRAKQLDYKKKKVVREQREAAESSNRDEARRQKRFEKRARNNRNKLSHSSATSPVLQLITDTWPSQRNKTLEQRDPDADYEPSSPVVSK
ncbi:hypothetical protein JMJ35_003154 [Cladonia borealis]|uniref:Uncharacterized protein n=1 Tax=Cladonia borealis TaxID=184061 RepID=A0AA39R436_9LECA|nr:hypothetical protein JMJ35_003154 [Cladonia borealis]